MSDTQSETLTVVVERDLPYSPDHIWPALTQPKLIEQWLMKTDFEPTVDRKFTLTGDWGGADCQVLAIEPDRLVSFTWATMGLQSVVTWTLTPTDAGSHLRLEQSGFRQDQQQFFQGATYGWRSFLGKLEGVLAQAA